MAKDYPKRENVAMPTTGDAAEDARQIDLFILREKRMIEGICPNGCGPMVPSAPNERDCPLCKFHQWSNVPFEEA